MKTLARGMTLALSLALGAACGDERAPDAQQTPSEDSVSAGMGAMEGMPNMPAMGSGGMMERMTAHMGSLHGVSGDSLQRMLPMHRQMVANMLAEMNREMREMNMSGDAAWGAAVDSLRQDLVRMP